MPKGISRRSAEEIAEAVCCYAKGMGKHLSGQRKVSAYATPDTNSTGIRVWVTIPFDREATQ